MPLYASNKGVGKQMLQNKLVSVVASFVYLLIV